MFEFDSPVSGTIKSISDNFQAREPYRSPSNTRGTTPVPETPQAPSNTPFFTTGFPRHVEMSLLLLRTPVRRTSGPPNAALASPPASPVSCQLFNPPTSPSPFTDDPFLAPVATDHGNNSATPATPLLVRADPSPTAVMASDIHSRSWTSFSPSQSATPELSALDVPFHVRTGAYSLDPNVTYWSEILRAHTLPQATLDRFPPDCSNHGRTEKGWYVVGKGDDFGIIFDFWENVQPLVLDPSAIYRRVGGYVAAYTLFKRWEGIGKTGRLSGFL